ncbi:MAG: hypothetical protein E7B46_16530, partial [Clostridium perfringens]|nr:hypothetical protein [Clostridium perfringens]
VAASYGLNDPNEPPFSSNTGSVVLPFNHSPCLKYLIKLVAFVTYPCLTTLPTGYCTKANCLVYPTSKTVMLSPSLTLLPGIIFPFSSLR